MLRKYSKINLTLILEGWPLCSPGPSKHAPSFSLDSAEDSLTPIADYEFYLESQANSDDSHTSSLASGLYMKSKPDSDQERSLFQVSFTLAFAIFAGAVVLMRRLLRRNKRPDDSHGITKPHKKIMKEPTGWLPAVNSHPAPETEAERDYDRRKLSLVAKDDGLHWYHKALKTATTSEIKAAKIIWKIREDERDNLFGNTATEAIPKPTTRDMGGQFLTNRERIKKSNVYKIALQMPKGAHLHLHFNAELEPNELISKAKDRPFNMFVRTTQPILNDGDFDETEIVFSILPDDTPRVDIFAPNYNPDFRSPGATPWMRWIDFREVYRQSRGEEAEDWALKKMILSEDEVYGMQQTTNG
jgi:hypothetical protein